MVAKPTLADGQYRGLLNVATLIVLHGPSTASAAIDIESKFTESALGHVQISDYRQFAHGRHHWLAKHPATTSVLSIESLDDEDIASQTLALLPESLPSRRVRVSQRGWIADLGAICEGFYLAGAAGRARGIDPGKPGVPPFGRKLYHANAFRQKGASDDLPRWKIQAIERKASHRIERLIAEDQLSFWLAALDEVLEKLANARFGGLVVDYDGTLCHEDRRFDPLPADITQVLSAHLASGMILGVATGRGKSVRERLHEALPKKYWSQVIVGYYNGGQLFRLSDLDMPDNAERVGSELTSIATAIQQDGLLNQGKITLRDRQITLNPYPGWFNNVQFSFGSILPPDFPLNAESNAAFLALADKYYDPSIENEHTRVAGTDAKLGFGQCALPLVLEHNTPNNSIALVWSDTVGKDGHHAMRPLFRRRQRHM
jgi:hypothetical protein